MKVTMMGVLPPERSICHYCLHLAEEVSEMVDLEYFSFKNLFVNFSSDRIKRAKEEQLKKLSSMRVEYIIVPYNPITWLLAGIRAGGEIVHVQHWAWYTGMIYSVILPILKIRGKRIVITIHNITPHMKNAFIRITDRIFNKIIFPLSDALIVHNERNKERLFQLYKVNDRKVFIITHGILRFDNISGKISKHEARKHLGIPRNKRVLLFFGYLWRYKGLDVLLKAMTNVVKKVKNVLLIVAGQPLPHWKEYIELIEELNLEDYVMVKLNYLSDTELGYYISASDVCVFPYKEPFDTHGGAAALALSFKKPIIVTDIGGLPSYVKDRRCIVKPEDTDALSEAIIELLSDKKLLQKLERDADELMEELSWENIARKTINVYIQITVDRDPSRGEYLNDTEISTILR